jgi:hypothetical protein
MVSLAFRYFAYFYLAAMPAGGNALAAHWRRLHVKGPNRWGRNGRERGRAMKASWLLLAAVVGLLAVGEASTKRISTNPLATSAPSIQSVEEAVMHRNVSAALREWEDAYRAAVARGRWEQLVEAADAYREIGEEVVGSRERFDARAREIYLAALFRARQQDSLDGVLRVAEAFAALGDRDEVERCVRIAERLAAQDAEAKADVQAVAARISAQRRS